MKTERLKNPAHKALTVTVTGQEEEFSPTLTPEDAANTPGGVEAAVNASPPSAAAPIGSLFPHPFSPWHLKIF